LNDTTPCDISTRLDQSNDLFLIPKSLNNQDEAASKETRNIIRTRCNVHSREVILRNFLNRVRTNNFLTVIIPLFCFIISCAAPQSQTPVDVERPSSNVFKSDDYIVYKYKEEDSPMKLASLFLGDEKKDWMIEEANEKDAFKKDNFIIIPLKIKNKGGVYTDGYQQVPILCYHQFGNTCKSNLCMPVDIFDEQMKYLKENGYRTITPDEIFQFLSYDQPIPKKSVMITIDDGYRSVYNHAIPILKKYGFSATFFIYIDYVGISKKAITWDQLRDLKEDGFTIGSHTLSHCDLTKKFDGESQNAYIRRITREIVESKRIIDEKLNQNTSFLSFPYGRYDMEVAEITEKAGYKIAVSVKRGSNPFFTNPYMLRRDQILKRDLKTFVSRLKTFNNNH